MVTIGFIVEGDSEAILIKSGYLQSYIKSLNLYCTTDFVINAKGKTHLYHPSGDFSKLEARVTGWLDTLEAKGAEKIFILLDMDDSDPCYTVFKSKVCSKQANIVIVAKQALEAWYLADTRSLATFLVKNIEEVSHPEAFLNPFEEIKRLNLLHQNRGVADKKILTNKMLHCGFSLDTAAAHPNCPSANYFKKQLLKISV